MRSDTVIPQHWVHGILQLEEMVQEIIWVGEMAQGCLAQALAPESRNTGALPKYGNGRGLQMALFCTSVNSLNLMYSLKPLSRSNKLK